MVVSHRTFVNPPGVELRDGEHGRRVRVETGIETSPKVVSAPFDRPMDEVIELRCADLHLPELPVGLIEGADGRVVEAIGPSVDARLGDGAFLLELHAAMKLHIRIPGPARVVANGDRLSVELAEPRSITIGVRAYHGGVTETITITSDPGDLLSAISRFGAALQTTSPERSYPTMRGHPPLLELGEELSVPTGLDPPETGVTLELPPNHRSAFVAAPLAHYLGADCEPAEAARLVTEGGFAHPLGEDRNFVEEVARVLKQCLLLDVVVRTEGIYETRLFEREALEERLPFDPAAIYGAPLAEQLEAYLAIPFADIAEHVSPWGVSATIPCDADHVRVLPHVVSQLGVVRPADGVEDLSPEQLRATLFQKQLADEETRGGAPMPERLVRLRPAEASEHVWFGEGIPVEGTKGVEAGYRHRHDRPTGDGPVEIVVVGQDDVGVVERSDLDTTYESDAIPPIQVTTHEDLGVDELAKVLEAPADFLHYVGHVDPDGFRCHDGHLSPEEVDRVGPVAFLLNGCTSYEHGITLVERGSVGGVVTFGDVTDSGAVQVGDAMARLLQRGFPLQPAFSIARGEHATGVHYLVVGDGTIDVVQPRHGSPILYDAKPIGDDGDYEVTVHGYLSHGREMGSVGMPYLAEGMYHLLPGALTTVRVTTVELRDHVDQFRDPVLLEGTLHWRREELPD